MMITRIFADDRGESHFSDIEVPLTLIAPAQGLPPMGMSPPIASTQVRFLVGPPALIAHDWHPAPARQFVLFSEGSLEAEVSDGQRRRFGQGAIVFLEDTRGKGHKDHVVNDDKLLLVLVPVSDEVNIEHMTTNTAEGEVSEGKGKKLKPRDTLSLLVSTKTWMVGPSPTMTMERPVCHSNCELV